jgi:hypothetical protein
MNLVRKSAKCLCLLALLIPGMLGVAVYADENVVSMTSVVLESWDLDSNTSVQWQAVGSSRASVVDGVQFPRTTIISRWPNSLYGSNPANSDNLRVLGVYGKFDQNLYNNYIDIYAVSPGTSELHELPLTGRVKSIDLWVWSANHDFSLNIYVRDYTGIIHELKIGSIKHDGWKNLSVNIPASIPQTQAVLPKLQSLKFVKLQIVTNRHAVVGDFQIYFDLLKMLSDVYETIYDGSDMTEPAIIADIWGLNN